MTVKELIQELVKLDWGKEVRIKQTAPFQESYSTPIDDIEDYDEYVKLVWYYKFEDDEKANHTL